MLLLDDEPLLLLEEAPDAEESDIIGADNSRCFVCHINYMQEDIAVIHARADIGCAGCHGESDEHIADESWASGGGKNIVPIVTVTTAWPLANANGSKPADLLMGRFLNMRKFL
ncbi:MAG: hypothetical protein ACYS80_17520 [Planctomycetota bacterium]